MDSLKLNKLISWFKTPWVIGIIVGVVFYYLNSQNFITKQNIKEKITDITVDFLIKLEKQTETCPLCGKILLETSIPYHPDQKQLDHIIPLSIGGKHIKDNVRIICGSCNNHRPRKGQDVKINTTT